MPWWGWLLFSIFVFIPLLWMAVFAVLAWMNRGVRETALDAVSEPTTGLIVNREIGMTLDGGAE